MDSGFVSGASSSTTSKCLQRFGEALMLGLSTGASLASTQDYTQIDIDIATIRGRLASKPWMQAHNYDTAYVFRRGFALGSALCFHSDTGDPLTTDISVCCCPIGPTSPLVHELCAVCASAFSSMVNDRNAVITTKVECTDNLETLQVFRDRFLKPGSQFPRIHANDGGCIPSQGVMAAPAHVWALFVHICNALSATGDHAIARHVIHTSITTGCSISSPRVLHMVATSAITLHVLAAVDHAVKYVLASLKENTHPFVAWNHCMLLLSAALTVLIEPYVSDTPKEMFEQHAIIHHSTFPEAPPPSTPQVRGIFFDTDFVSKSFQDEHTVPPSPQRAFHLCRELVMLAHGMHLTPGFQTIHKCAEDLCITGRKAPICVLEIGADADADIGIGVGVGVGAGAGSSEMPLTRTTPDPRLSNLTYWMHEFGWG